MAFTIKNNISALKILNIMNRHSNALAKSMQRISTGKRINSAADDPSGYAIATKMRIQISCLDRAAENAQRGINMLKTAEGAVNSTIDILTSLKEKAINAANDTCSTADRKIIQEEFNQLIDQINDNANVTFNGKNLMDGSLNRKIENPVANVFTNEALSTATTANSALIDLLDRNGNKLDIKSSDTIKISFVSGGKTLTTSYDAKSTKLSDIFTNANIESTKILGVNLFNATIGANSCIGVDATGVSVYTADGSSTISVTANTAGVGTAISGFSISVIGTDGNVKKSINEKLDAFNESIRAFDKSNDNVLTLQIGAKATQSIKVGLTDMRAEALGLQGTNDIDGRVKNIDVTTKDNANAAINVIDKSLQRALQQQTNIGAVENRLKYTIDNLTTQSENLTAAESTIFDVNIAKEITEFTKNNILMQAAQAMLAQANQTAMGILRLLK